VGPFFPNLLRDAITTFHKLQEVSGDIRATWRTTKVLSTLAIIVAEFGDSRRFRPQIVASVDRA